jgi:hypothetical protein
MQVLVCNSKAVNGSVYATQLRRAPQPRLVQPATLGIVHESDPAVA